jgi:hypothetical protein
MKLQRQVNIHHRLHKLQFFRSRMPGRCFPQVAAPAKQLLRRQPMTASHGTDRVTTRNDLRNNPCLVLVASLPPTTGSCEDFQPLHRLRDSTMHRVRSKPNGQNQTEARRSAHQPKGGRRTPLTLIRLIGWTSFCPGIGRRRQRTPLERHDRPRQQGPSRHHHHPGRERPRRR